MNIAQIKGIVPTSRFGLAGLITLAVAAGGIMTVSSPAFAAPITPIVSTCLTSGSIGYQPNAGSEFGALCHATNDFSYSSTGQQEARNVVVSADLFPQNTNITFGWRDTTANGPWTYLAPVAVGGPNSNWYGFGTDAITGIPRTACGHTLQISATGQVWQGYNYATETGYASIAENCGPMVGWNNGVLSGDGFTPGGSVLITAKGPSGGILTTQTVKATTEVGLGLCRRIGFTIVCTGYLVLTAPGTISVSNLPVPTSCGVFDTYTILDETTHNSVVTSQGWGCIN